jgi:ASC-1-like (ASCH) protein
MKMRKTGARKINIKCNNHKIKQVASFKYLGSKMMGNGTVKEEITKKNRKYRTFLPIIDRQTLEKGNR